MLEKVQQDLKNAMLARDEVTTSTLRMLLSELKNAGIAKGDTLSDQEAVAVVQKEAKKRKEAAQGFRQGGREEAALKEESELKVLEQYLPTQISDEDLNQIVAEAIEQTGASGMADMGKVIGIVMSKVGQTADGARVSSLIKAKLS
jgi:uncharacterized protein